MTGQVRTSLPGDRAPVLAVLGTVTLYRFDGTRHVALTRGLVSRNGTLTLAAALRPGDWVHCR